MKSENVPGTDLPGIIFVPLLDVQEQLFECDMHMEFHTCSKGRAKINILILATDVIGQTVTLIPCAEISFYHPLTSLCQRDIFDNTV
jgi:uncharacterized protein (DUF983 family)